MTNSRPNSPTNNKDITPNDPPTNVTSEQVIIEPGLEIHTIQGTDNSGNNITQVTFESTHPELYDPNITEDLEQIIDVYDDVENAVLVTQIQSLATQIKCESFHGKGTIDDYKELFDAACKIANETTQIQLDVDVEGFNEIGQAADQLSALFITFTEKLQNVNIINDSNFLQAIVSALQKLVNLSNVFGKFKETIITTTTIQIPKSAHETTVVIQNVMGELNCAMNYIGYFVDASNNPNLQGAQLSPEEKNIIDKATTTIESWNLICEQGVSIAMNNDTDIQYIKQVSNQLKQTSNTLNQMTSQLRNKLNLYMSCSCD
jgi:hypothetical protein